MNNHTKIVSIIPYKILPSNLGGEKSIGLFHEYLGRYVPLTVITTKNNDPSLALSYKLLNILSVNKLKYINVFLYFQIRKILIREKATHLFIEHPYYGWLAWLLHKTLPVKWIVRSQNIEYMRSKSIGRKWWKALKIYEKWVYHQADLVFYISEDDRQYAVKELKTEPGRSLVATYGVQHSSIPEDIASCRKTVKDRYKIAEDEKILLFNGALYHSTNYDALTIILKFINPILISNKDFKYKIIICGKGLPDFFNELREYAHQNIIYAGFVEDVSIYFKAADIFLNPILSGGGIKTKAVEALSMDCTVISTELGAMGINRSVCGAKLSVITSNNWKDFGNLVISSSKKDDQIPESFFNYYSWTNIIQWVITKLN